MISIECPTKWLLRLIQEEKECWYKKKRNIERANLDWTDFFLLRGGEIGSAVGEESGGDIRTLFMRKEEDKRKWQEASVSPHRHKASSDHFTSKNNPLAKIR